MKILAILVFKYFFIPDEKNVYLFMFVYIDMFYRRVFRVLEF